MNIQKETDKQSKALYAFGRDIVALASADELQACKAVFMLDLLFAAVILKNSRG